MNVMMLIKVDNIFDILLCLFGVLFDGGVISYHFDDSNEVIFFLAGGFEGGDDLVVVGG
jgi:hypothetical protein